MNAFNQLIHNTVFMSAATGWLVAQILKTIIYGILNKTFNPERMVGSGGMPSSHSATVTALATASGIQYGLGSFEFAVSAIVAIIVMYDARGVRLETGKQAQVLNEVMEILQIMGKKMSYEDKLKEFVGHTPVQVVVGALLGILIALIYCFI
ncbi:MAG: divergent PAP2 family protein [Lachnospiraceae bacterium]|nr:divergent PAP2 family protein [Lachnospiraceae bacterium]